MPQTPPSKRPGNEKVIEQTDVNLAQVVSRQAQLERMVEDTNHAIHTIKQLLERMVIPPAQSSTRLRSAVWGPRVKQQVAKVTTHGNATSTYHANSEQVSLSRAESTYSATTIKRKHDEAGPSWPQNIFASSHTTKPDTIAKSRQGSLRKTLSDHPAMSSTYLVEVEVKTCAPTWRQGAIQWPPEGENTSRSSLL